MAKKVKKEYGNYSMYSKISQQDKTPDLYNLDKKFDELIKKFPNAKKELVKRCGEKMYRRVIENIETTVGEDTLLIDAVEKVIGSNGGYIAVKPNWRIAPHTHLVENGHRIVIGKNPSKSAKKYFGAQDERKAIGWVAGKHMYRNALNELVEELEKEGEKMIDELIGDIFG